MAFVSSRDNPLVKRLRALAASARECRKRGETLLDGPHLVAAALDAGIVPKAIAVAESGLRHTEIEALVAPRPDLVTVMPDALFAQVSPVQSPAGIVALIGVPPAPTLPAAGDRIVLDGVQDAGNLGSLLRSAAAARMAGVLLTEGCAQAWSPRVLRGGMGAHFRLAIVEQVDPAAALAGFRGRIVATVPAADSVSLFDCDLTGDVAWLFGSEGAGLSPAVAALADLRVHIPMPGGSESLNVGAAAAICLFEQVRQRGATRR